MNLKRMLVLFALLAIVGISVFAEGLENTIVSPNTKNAVIEGQEENSLGLFNYGEVYKVSGEEYDVPEGADISKAPESRLEASKASSLDPSPTSLLLLKNKTPLEINTGLEEKEDSSVSPLLKGAATRWAGDILVSSDRVGTGQDMDTDEVNGYLYAIYDTNVSTNDKANIYRSTNSGESWAYWSTMTNTDGRISNPKIRVARDSSGNTWVCSMAIWLEPDGTKKLYLRKLNPSTGSGSFYQATTYDVDYVDMDADVGTGAWIYITFVRSNSGNDVYAARFNLDTNTWSSSTSLFVDPGTNPEPAIAAGVNGTVSVAFLDTRLTTNEEIRIKRSTNYGSSWVGSAQVSNNSSAANLSDVDIAYTRATTQTGWIFAAFQFSGDTNMAYYLSTNSGSSWTYQTVIGLSGSGLYDNNISIRAKKAGGSLTVVYNHDPGDEVHFTWASSSSPTNFTAPVAVNNYAGTGNWSPTAGWTSNYSAALYSSYAQSYKLYYDYFGN